MFFKVRKSDGLVEIIENISVEQIGPDDVNVTTSDLVNFDTIKINIQKEYLNYIAIPACADIELYFYETEKELILSDNFYKVCTQLDKVEENKIATSFFLSKSYTSSGDTLIDRVSRLRPSRVYQIKHNSLSSHHIEYRSSVYEGNKSDYENFVNCLERICSNSAADSKVGVLFSGGVDSLTLALTLEKLDIPFTLYTGRQIQEFHDNEIDVLRSASIAKAKNWEHKIIPIDYNNYELKDFHKLIDLMPTTSNLSILFLELTKKIKEDGVKICFTGQNLDILYNFEATTSLGFNRGAVVNLVRRFFLSEIYFSSLKSPVYRNILLYLVAKFCLLGYCIMRKSFEYRLPKNRDELFYNFTHSADNTVFTHKKNPAGEQDYCYNFKDDESLRAPLTRSRIEESLTSGAPMSVINAGKINDVKIVLPYSSELLIPFFMNLKESAKDIFRPKKIIHEFVKANFINLSKHNIQPKKSLPNFHFWSENIFPKTKLGKSIGAINNNECSNMPTSALKLSCNFSYHWKNHVLKTIEDKKSDR